LPQVLFFQRELHQRVQKKDARRSYYQKNKNFHETRPSSRLQVPVRTTCPQRGCDYYSA
jgi:hypothetical protein